MELRRRAGDLFVRAAVRNRRGGGRVSVPEEKAGGVRHGADGRDGGRFRAERLRRRASRAEPGGSRSRVGRAGWLAGARRRVGNEREREREREPTGDEPRALHRRGRDTLKGRAGRGTVWHRGGVPSRVRRGRRARRALRRARRARSVAGARRERQTQTRRFVFRGSVRRYRRQDVRSYARSRVSSYARSSAVAGGVVRPGDPGRVSPAEATPRALPLERSVRLFLRGRLPRRRGWLFPLATRRGSARVAVCAGRGGAVRERRRRRRGRRRARGAGRARRPKRPASREKATRAARGVQRSEREERRRVVPRGRRVRGDERYRVIVTRGARRFTVKRDDVFFSRQRSNETPRAPALCTVARGCGVGADSRTRP